MRLQDGAARADDSLRDPFGLALPLRFKGAARLRPFLVKLRKEPGLVRTLLVGQQRILIEGLDVREEPEGGPLAEELSLPSPTRDRVQATRLSESVRLLVIFELLSPGRHHEDVVRLVPREA